MPSLAGFKPMGSHELPVYSRLPVTLVRGKGCRVWDDAGKDYIDFYGGHAVAALGYGHPKLSQAIAEQAHQLVFQTNAVHVAIREAACAALAGVAPTGVDQILLVNSGAEANENALRLAFWKTNRTRVACLKGSFHGRTAAAGAITDFNEKWYGFPQAPFEIDWIAPEDFNALEALITDDTAAFIFEPVQGVAGAIDISSEFAQMAAQICKARGALLIADEVQTGIGRTGTMFAIEQLGITPDILTTAKGLGGGFPVAAVLCAASIADGVGIGMLGTTFGGGPMACAAMKAVLDEVSNEEFLVDVRRRSELLKQTCLEAGAKKVSGRGFLIGLHLAQPAAPVRKSLLDKGFLTGDAKNPHVVRLLPPLIISDEEIAAFGKALKEVLA